MIDQLFASAAGGGYQLTVDLELSQVRDEDGLKVEFSVDSFRRQCLMEGLDDIDLTLQHEDRITVYEQSQG